MRPDGALFFPFPPNPGGSSPKFDTIMNLHSTLHAAALAVALTPALTAQDLAPRPEVQLSSGLVTTSIYGFSGWQIASPKQALPADPARNLAHTARVVYTAWPDLSAPGSTDIVLRFARSTDGGWSWNPLTAIDVWTADSLSGETFDAVGLDLLADGHNVFLVITADRNSQGLPDPQQRDFCWVLGSNDQGQTWQAINVTSGIDAPLSTGDQLLDVDDPIAAASAGRCHVLFEADYQFAAGTGAASAQEDVFYQAVEFDAQGNLVLVFPEERRMDGTPSGAVDSDFPGIAVDGANLVLHWQDDRGSVNGGFGADGRWNDTYSRCSNDAGATFGAEYNHTNQQGPIAWANNRQSKSAAVGSTLIVFQEDGRNGEDDVYMSRSIDGGLTWVDGTRVSTEPVGIDLDGFNFHMIATPSHPAGRIALQWKDDRQGTGNTDNDTYAVIDYNGGADFEAGLQQEITLIDVPTNTTIYNVDSFGDTIVFANETSNFPEDAGFAFSTDDGQTFQWRSVLQFGNADCDDIYAAVTQNRDIQVIWQDDDNLGNDFNNVYTRGMKVPVLEDLTSTGQGIRLSLTAASDQNDPALLLASIAGGGSNGFTLDAANGIVMNLIPDGLTLAVASNIGAFINFVDPATGTVTWQQPNWAQLTGLTITWAAAMVDIQTNAVTTYTDPIIQR